MTSGAASQQQPCWWKQLIKELYNKKEAYAFQQSLILAGKFFVKKKLKQFLAY